MRTLYLFLIIVGLSEIVAAEKFERINLSENWSKHLVKQTKASLYDNTNVYYQNISTETMTIIEKKMRFEKFSHIKISGIPGVKNIFVMFTNVKKNYGEKVWFIKVYNNKFDIIYSGKDLLDTSISGATFFKGTNLTFVALQPISKGESDKYSPILFEVTDKNLVEFPQLPFSSACRKNNCNQGEDEPLFAAAEVSFEKGAYYINFFHTLYYDNDDSKMLQLKGNKKFLFKLTPQKFERVPELEK